MFEIRALIKDIEDIKGFLPSVEIESADKIELIKLINMVKAGEIIKKSIPKVMSETILGE